VGLLLLAIGGWGAREIIISIRKGNRETTFRFEEGGDIRIGGADRVDIRFSEDATAKTSDLDVDRSDDPSRANASAASPDLRSDSAPPPQPPPKAVARLRMTLTQHDKEVVHLAFSPGGKRLASAGAGKVIVWNAESFEPERVIQPDVGDPQLFPAVLAFSPNGKTLAVSVKVGTPEGGPIGRIRRWDLETGDELPVLDPNTSRIHGLAYSPDGKFLASTAWDETLTIWDLERNEQKKLPPGFALESVAFSPKGDLLASCSKRGLRIWDVMTWEVRHEITERTGGLAVAFSPDGGTVAVNETEDCKDGTRYRVRLYDAASGEPRTVTPDHPFWMKRLAFSPDGRILAGCGAGTDVFLWDAATGETLQTIKAHSYWVFGLAFSPDGQTLATASVDASMKIWDLGTGKGDG